MSSISKSNDESLINVLGSWVFHNVHFRLFSELKMRFLFIRQRVFLSHDFGYNCVGIWSFCKDQLFLTLINVKKSIFIIVHIFICKIYRWYFNSTVYARQISLICTAQICLMWAFFLNLLRDMRRRFFEVFCASRKLITIKSQLSEYS